VDLLAAHTFYY
jgi:hypothetical protein